MRRGRKREAGTPRQRLAKRRRSSNVGPTTFCSRPAGHRTVAAAPVPAECGTAARVVGGVCSIGLSWDPPDRTWCPFSATEMRRFHLRLAASASAAAARAARSLRCASPSARWSAGLVASSAILSSAWRDASWAETASRSAMAAISPSWVAARRPCASSSALAALALSLAASACASSS
eukprot:scaffold18025_cov107-Isochrysis_galbana.AAC.3